MYRKQIHKDHIGDTGFVFPCRTITWFINRVPYRVQWQFRRQRLLSTRNEKLAESSSWWGVKSEHWSWGDTPSNIGRHATFILPLRIGEKVPDGQMEEWYWEVILRETIQGTTLYLGSKVFQRHYMTSAKSFGRYFKKACVAAGAYTHVMVNNEPEPLDQITESKKTSILGLKLWSSCTLERNLYGHPVAGFWWERRHLRNICLRQDGETSPDGSAHTFIAENRYSCQCMLAGKRKHAKDRGNNVEPDELDDPTSLFDQVYLGCIERAAQGNIRIVMG